MADGDFSLATLWVPVAPETSKVGPAMEDAGKEGKRRFGDGFDASGIGSEIGVVLGKGLSTSAGSAALEHLPKSLGDAVGSMANQVGNEGKTLGDALGTELGNAVGSIARDQLPTSITGAVDSIKDRVGNEGKSLGEAIGIELGAAAGDAIRDHLPDRVKTSIDSVKNQVGNEGKTLGDALGTELGSAVGDAFRDSAAGKTVNEFFAAVNTASDHVRGGIENVHTAIAGLKSGDAGTALDGISGSLESINSLAQTFGGDVHEWTGPLDEVLSKTGSIVDDFGNMKDGISEFASLIEADAPAIATALNEALGPIAIVATALYTIYNGLPGIGGGMKDILGAPDPTKGFNSPVQGPPGIPVTGPKPLTLPPGLGGTGPAVPPGYTATPGSLDPFAALLPPGMAPPPGTGPGALPSIAPPDMPDGSPPSGAGSGTNWDAIHPHEAGSWNANTGNGYYGGLQFDQPTWNEFGGQDFAPRADLTSRENQITVANRVPPEQRAKRWPDTYKYGANQGSAGSSAASLPDVRGAHPQLAYALGAAKGMFPDLTLTAGKDDHPMDQGWHPRGQAIDIGGGTPQEQAQFSNWLLQFAPEIEELIHSGPGVTQNIKSGKIGPAIDMPGSVYSTGQAGYHGDHVHLAVTDQMASMFEAAISGRGASSGADRAAVSGPTGAQHDPIYTAQADTGTGGAGGSSSTQDQAQQLGSGLVNGVLQEFGLDGSVFKSFGGSSNPLQFGITKLATGLINTFAGGARGGDGASLGGLGGGGGSILPGLGGLIPHPAATAVPIGPSGSQSVSGGDTHIYHGPVNSGPQLSVTQNGVQSPTEDLQAAANGAGNRVVAQGVTPQTGPPVP